MSAQIIIAVSFSKKSDLVKKVIDVSKELRAGDEKKGSS
jgi:hypothetical protein